MSKKLCKIVNNHNDVEVVVLLYDDSNKVGYRNKKDAVTKLNYLRKTSKKNRPLRVYYDGEFWRLTKKEHKI